MKLDANSVEWAIKSLYKHGDTDLFPKPIELEILNDNLSDSVGKICDIDIAGHSPSAPRRFIVPKDELSYRAATQLDPLDSVILTALMHKYGNEIEKRRRAISENSVFSYRFSPSSDGDLYQSHAAWNQYWEHCYKLAETHGVALIVDISDFYNQIYHHTLENQLQESGLPNQGTKWLLRLLETVSVKVSRGIPVGPHAAHLLAEASLIPVDNSLATRGLVFCRFVDDVIVFASNKTTARINLYQIAEILDKQQRLQLQKSKTRILEPSDLKAFCKQMIEDRPINDFEEQIVDIIRKYSKGNPYRTVYLSELSDEDVKIFQPEIVEKVLSDYLAEGTPDFIRLRWFLRRLSQVGHSAALEFCLNNFEKLAPAISDVCHYFVSVSRNSGINWGSVGNKLIGLLENEIVRSNEYFQMSILSLFNKEPQLNHIPHLVSLYKGSSNFLKREIILAAAESGHADWIRELKEEFSGMDPWTRRALIYATRRLPIDERKFFLRTITSNNLLESIITGRAKA